MLPITLIFAASAALINIWLSIRIGRTRGAHKVGHGDGGVPILQRRMRAQLNFIEYTPIVLILCLLVELAYGPSIYLWATAALYILARVAHGIGMDAEVGGWPRSVGIIVTLLVSLGLALAALWAGYAGITSPFGMAAEAGTHA